MTDHDSSDAPVAEGEDATIGGDLRDAATAIARAGRRTGRRLTRRGRDVLESSRESIDRSVQTVTLKTYRDEVDEALQEVVDVLAAHDAEIRELHARVRELEGQSTSAEESES